MRIAREALVESEAPCTAWVVRFPLAARLGQCCGGVATVAFSTLDASAAGWIEAAASARHARAPFAIVGRLGSDAGASRIVVAGSGVRGTLGDARLDAAAVAAARERIDAERVAGAARQGTGLAGSGDDSLFVHVVHPDAFDVLVFGNGHVGRALVHVLGAVPANVRWIDSRDHDFPDRVPANVEVVATDAPEDEIARAPLGAYVVVMTHSHALDFELVAAALVRDDWRYLGLIGSRSKRAQFERRLAARGAPARTLHRVTCPIGVAGIRSKEPGAIAIAVAAELLAVRERDAAALAHAHLREG
jgi:xanthine dehydrogenase accessory factor